MAQTTEAACLLDHGALYGRRVLLTPVGDAAGPIFAGFKAGAFSLYFGDAPIAHFDLEGRWQRAYFDDLHWVRSLDGTVRTVDRVREGANLTLHRQKLDPAPAAVFDERMRRVAVDLLADLDAGRLGRSEPPAARNARPLSDAELRAFLGRVAGWDAEAWARDRATYASNYTPLPFLPPECLQAVVLQATRGGPAGPFVGAGGPPAAQTADGFETHARAVAGLLGRRLAQCRNVYLAGPDVLTRPAADVSAYLDAVARVFRLDPGAPPRRPETDPDVPVTLEGVHALLDRLDAALPPADVLATWRAKGLSRVSLGVESGSPAVRALHGKAWPKERLAEAVRAFKGAGLHVGVIVLVGAGGAAHADEHLAATAEAVGALELGAGDLVSLVDADALGEAAAVADPAAAPLSGPARDAQRAALRERLEPLRKTRGAKVAPYVSEGFGAR